MIVGPRSPRRTTMTKSALWGDRPPTPPSEAVVRHRAQGSHRTLGTVAFPSATLHCRTSIYTTFVAEIPTEVRILGRRRRTLSDRNREARNHASTPRDAAPDRCDRHRPRNPRGPPDRRDLPTRRPTRTHQNDSRSRSAHLAATSRTTSRDRAPGGGRRGPLNAPQSQLAHFDQIDSVRDERFDGMHLSDESVVMRNTALHKHCDGILRRCFAWATRCLRKTTLGEDGGSADGESKGGASWFGGPRTRIRAEASALTGVICYSVAVKLAWAVNWPASRGDGG